MRCGTPHDDDDDDDDNDNVTKAKDGKREEAQGEHPKLVRNEVNVNTIEATGEYKRKIALHRFRRPFFLETCLPYLAKFVSYSATSNKPVRP